jgi:hypothetical protein
LRPTRDGVARGQTAIDNEKLAITVFEWAEKAVDEAYRVGFMNGYMARAEDEDDADQQG